MTTATAPGRPATADSAAKTPREPRKRKPMRSPYPTWFFIPAGVFYVVLFLVPTIASFYFSLTRWTLFDVEFIGFDNFVRFFQEPQLVTGFVNTFIYAFLTSGLKVVLGLLLGVFLSSQIIGRGFLRATVFFPVLVSTIGSASCSRCSSTRSAARSTRRWPQWASRDPDGSPTRRSH